MTAPNTRHPQQVQRNISGFSLSPREQARRDSIIRDAWCAIPKGFSCRPAPRSAWDHAVDGTEARWNKVLEPMRMAVASAVFIGNRELIEQTMEGVRDFLRALEADVASIIPPEEEQSVQILALLETDCAGEARREEMALVISPTPTEAERAIRPIAREVDALARVLTWCERAARQPQMQRHA